MISLGFYCDFARNCLPFNRINDKNILRMTGILSEGHVCPPVSDYKREKYTY